jgi:hypothetical protein
MLNPANARCHTGMSALRLKADIGTQPRNANTWSPRKRTTPRPRSQSPTVRRRWILPASPTCLMAPVPRAGRRTPQCSTKRTSAIPSLTKTNGGALEDRFLDLLDSGRAADELGRGQKLRAAAGQRAALAGALPEILLTPPQSAALRAGGAGVEHPRVAYPLRRPHSSPII